MLGKKSAEIEYKHVPGLSVQPKSIKEGLLNKETSHKNWRLRYVYLLQDAIYCYSSRGSEYVKTVIPLGPGSRIFDIAKGPGFFSGFFFSVTGVCTATQKKEKLFREREGKSINFYADSKEDKLKWMNAIGFVIAGKIESARAYSDKKPPAPPSAPHPERKVPMRPPPRRPDGAPSPNRKAGPPPLPPRNSAAGGGSAAPGGGGVTLSSSASLGLSGPQVNTLRKVQSFSGSATSPVNKKVQSYSGSAASPVSKKVQPFAKPSVMPVGKKMQATLHPSVSAASSAAQIGKGNRSKFEICAICCSAIVVAKERILIDNKYVAHENCFKCAACSKKLNSVVPDYKSIDNTYFCLAHYELVMNYRLNNKSTDVVESSSGKKWDIDWSNKKWTQK